MSEPRFRCACGLATDEFGIHREPCQDTGEQHARLNVQFGHMTGPTTVASLLDQLTTARASLASVRAALAAARERAEGLYGRDFRAVAFAIHEVCAAVEDALDGEEAPDAD